MSGNSFGTLFCVTSFGESHGAAYGGVVDGCPPGLELSAADLQAELDRRKPGSSRHVTQRRESDAVEILSGLYEGRTTGTPIGFLVRNEDARSKDYAEIARKFRPGHADYTYWQKYGIRDPRGGGRASARETVVRVAAGAIARKWLGARYGVRVRGYLAQLGPRRIPFQSWEAVGANPFFAPNAGIVPELEKFMDELRASGDSCGARVNVAAEKVPVGWGEPVYRRLDADIAALQVVAPGVVRQRHLESVSNRMSELRATYELTNLRPGTAENAMSFKRDPLFPDFTDPNRIQVITVAFSYDPDPKQVARRAWQTRVKETFDFTALAALID